LHLKKKPIGLKIKISILGYGYIAKDFVSGVIRYNNKNPEDTITINNILVKDKSKYIDENYNFTEILSDILDNESDLIVDLMNNKEASLSYLPQIFDKHKSVLLPDKVLVSEHGNIIFNEANKNDVMVLIGSCISADMPIHLSTKNPYYTGEEYKEKRGNSSADFSAAILEDILYFYS
jgi:homoserine dehydrogenase